MKILKNKTNLGLSRLNFRKPFEPILFGDDEYGGLNILELMKYDHNNHTSYFEDDYIKLIAPYEVGIKTTIIAELKPYILFEKNTLKVLVSNNREIWDDANFLSFIVVVNDIVLYEGFLVKLEYMMDLFKIINKNEDLYYRFTEGLHSSNIKDFLTAFPNLRKEKKINFLSSKFDITKDELMCDLSLESVQLFFELFVKGHENSEEWVSKFKI
ncbi:hypothetical protein [Tenacibaculum maritimum]|uniref:hypothetical protein n=2 Tax=Tenacibaculum maritimum TaxID=107401 RepID=UPI0012E449D9|nr:hypothetical protein [Tenacibaculum maritimum]MCD9583736.1 hypothetical protein [Tenacibaculum maritimum]MCD9619464.1 hypothetical protein [Tenacibaculum maritimum]MCD9626194.1 hypothetical protein [Tenacibaculum maritimum]MCD9629186.1 hypothetical protein [Tenacibaculum maritimum]MCD9631593.1 hypothetical protein [Tenacibaculum maritimum]